MSIRVTLKGQEVGKQALRKLATLSQQMLSARLEESLVKIHRDTVDRAPVDVGILRASYKWELTSDGLGGSVGSDSKYAGYVEFGTRPHFPPVAPLEEWARRHGMPGMGFAIARAISIRGTAAQPHLTPAYQAEAPHFVRNIKSDLRLAVQQAAVR